MIATIVILAGTAIGVGFICFGIRGKRIGQELRCPKCEYDLSGKPHDSTRCSECGADLRDSHAIVHGQLRRRWGYVAMGLLVLLSCGIITAVRFARVDFTPYKPTSWLIRDAQNGNWITRDTAFNELIRRVNTGAIANAKLNELIQLALAEQQRGGRYWLPNWGRILEAAWLAGRLSPSDQDTYIRQAVGLKLDVVSPVHRGDPITFLVDLDQGKLGDLLIRGSVEWTDLRVDGNLMQMNVAQSTPPYQFRLQSSAWGGDLPSAWLPEEFSTELSVGEHKAACVWLLNVHGDAVLNGPIPKLLSGRVVTKTVIGSGTYNVVEPAAIDR